MTGGWKAKRFWSAVSVSEVDGGYGVMLDARRVMTPGKIPLTLPSRMMAHAIAAEWDAQEGEIAPLSMPVTRAANSAIERVTPQRAEVAAMLAAYAETDLICHRAAAPVALVAGQAAAWDPLLAWADAALAAPLIATVGVLPVDQPPTSLARLAAQVAALDAFKLTGLHDLVTISGSLIIALATTAGRLAPEQAWAISRIDEDWQIAQWGADEEAAAMAAHKRSDFLRAAQFWAMSHPD
ncbi:ATP12 family chaperone protein [Roseicyclus sp.]|uniref:ATP12 family chaperone protein n=1 Tax=Roseicyclus sp. TaxID=1914329 RepID=UPI001BCCC23C|nr:ATP12 family protein [Roseicyclus sp.]